MKDLLPYPILNLAVRGDEIRSMMGVTQRRRLRTHLMDKSRDFNVLLFSGGGNDVVGEVFRLWIRDREAAGGDPRRALNDAAFGSMLQVIAAAYEDLIALRNEARAIRSGRRIAVLLHGYDWAIPSGRGVCGFGPWLKPSLDDRGWDKLGEATGIVKEALQRFDALLTDLADRHTDVHVVPTQGTLRGTRDWNDELHPTGAGFKKIAKKFQQVIAAAFPEATA